MARELDVARGRLGVLLALAPLALGVGLLAALSLKRAGPLHTWKTLKKG
jgi:hypothetical protein